MISRLGHPYYGDKYSGGVAAGGWSGGAGARNASYVGLYDPSKDQWTEGKDDLSAVGTLRKYNGGVLLPDGRVVLVPGNAKHVGLYDRARTTGRRARMISAVAAMYGRWCAAAGWSGGVGARTRQARGSVRSEQGPVDGGQG